MENNRHIFSKIENVFEKMETKQKRKVFRREANGKYIFRNFLLIFNMQFQITIHPPASFIFREAQVEAQCLFVTFQQR